MQVLVPAHHIQSKYGTTTTELARWRRQGIGPAYYQPAPRIVRYDIGDVDDWYHDPANAHLHDLPLHPGTRGRRHQPGGAES